MISRSSFYTWPTVATNAAEIRFGSVEALRKALLADDAVVLARLDAIKKPPFPPRPPVKKMTDPQDEIRAEFLKDLDDAEHLTLRDWETNFLESNLSRTTFSEKQRIVIDRLRDRYQNRL